MTEDDDDLELEAGPDADDADDAEFEEPDLGDDLDDELVGELEELEDDVLEDDEFDTLDSVIAGEDDEEKEEVRPRVRTGDDKDDEDEEEVDPDDVEADLDTILKDRLEAYDEDAEEEEEEEVGPAATVDENDLPQKREGEFPCVSCFLLVNASQVRRTGYCPHCGDPIQVPAELL